MNNVELKKGIIINFISKYSNIIIQLIITSILARILTPTEYGVIAVIMIFITFFNLLGNMGIGPAIIQNKKLDENDISNIFIFTFFISIFLSFIFYIFSYIISFIYENDIYIPMGKFLSITIMLNILCIVPNSILLKNKKFKIVGIVTIISNLFSGIITILLALKGFSYYSLIINSILQSFVSLVLFLHFSKIKVDIKTFNFRSIKKIRGFSTYQFLFNFINYFSRNSDNLLIGKFMGADNLGYYDKAYRLMLYPIQNLTFVITPVLQPILSEYEDQKEVIFIHYKKIVKFLALIGAFITVFCFFSAKEIIVFLYGNQWIESVSIFKILSLSIGIQMILSSSGAIFQATNNTHKLFVSGIYVAVVTIFSILVGIYLGKVNYVAVGILVAYIINFVQTYYILIRDVFNESLVKFLCEIKTSLLIMAIMCISYKMFPVEINNNNLSIIIKFFTGLVSYFIGLIITKEYKLFLSVIRR